MVLLRGVVDSTCTLQYVFQLILEKTDPDHANLDTVVHDNILLVYWTSKKTYGQPHFLS